MMSSSLAESHQIPHNVELVAKLLCFRLECGGELSKATKGDLRLIAVNPHTAWLKVGAVG